MSDDYIVKPVYKALQVLQCLGTGKHAMALTEISHRVGIPKTTVFRYLRTLETCGFVVRNDDTDLYSLGMRIYQLGRAVNERLQFRELAIPHMERLRDRFNETVNLGVLEGSEVMYIEMVESRHSLRMQAEVGSRDPVYTTALGKAILAYLPRDQRELHLPATLIPRTENTLIDRAALEADLQRTWERGFAIDNQENELGARCLGVPIFDSSGHVVAAMSVSSPVSRLTEEREEDIIASLIQTGKEVTAKLQDQ